MRNSPFAVRRRVVRPGFTLVELLVVIAIIGVLASITVGTVMIVRQSQDKRFTETMLSQLATALELQWKAVIDQSRDEGLTPGVLQLANGDLRRAKVINTKLKLKQALPNTFADALTPNLDLQPASNFIAALGGGQSSLNGPPQLPPPPPNADDWQSSALLYLAVSRASRGMAAFNPEEAIGANFIRTVTLPIPSAASPKSYKAFKCLVDIYGTPLRVYTFPYNCTELNVPPYINTSLPPNQRDPQDPEGTLVDPRWNNANNIGAGKSVTVFQQLLHPLPTPGDTTAHYLIPVIVSAGKDQDFGGAYDRVNVDLMTGDASYDNIYSHRLRQFGQRGDR